MDIDTKPGHNIRSGWIKAIFKENSFSKNAENLSLELEFQYFYWPKKPDTSLKDPTVVCEKVVVFMRITMNKKNALRVSSTL